MPNKIKRDKKSRTASRRAPRPATVPLHSVKALLERRNAVFSEASVQGARQDEWRTRLASLLPDSLGDRVSGAVEKPGELIVYAESAVWAARLRYAIADLESMIRAARPEIVSISVRVLPRTAR